MGPGSIRVCQGPGGGGAYPASLRPSGPGDSGLSRVATAALSGLRASFTVFGPGCLAY